MGLMSFISVRNFKDLLDQISCPWEDMIVPRWRASKILKLNVWKKRKQSFHVFTSFLHLEKCLGLLETLIDRASVNWIQTRNWKAQRNNIQNIMLLKMHPSIHQTLPSTSKTMQQSKTDEIVFLWRQCIVITHLNLDQCLYAHVASTNILQKAATGSTYVDYFMLFSHKMPRLLFKNPASSVFLIQINTVLLKKCKSQCKTVFGMLLSLELLN